MQLPIGALVHTKATHAHLFAMHADRVGFYGHQNVAKGFSEIDMSGNVVQIFEDTLHTLFGLLLAAGQQPGQLCLPRRLPPGRQPADHRAVCALAGFAGPDADDAGRIAAGAGHRLWALPHPGRAGAAVSW